MISTLHALCGRKNRKPFALLRFYRSPLNSIFCAAKNGIKSGSQGQGLAVDSESAGVFLYPDQPGPFRCSPAVFEFALEVVVGYGTHFNRIYFSSFFGFGNIVFLNFT
jgi:hypothetical protein